MTKKKIQTKEVDTFKLTLPYNSILTARTSRPGWECLQVGMVADRPHLPRMRMPRDMRNFRATSPK